MHIKFSVLVVFSIALWQNATSFVINAQEPMMDVTHSSRILFNTVSILNNTVSSAVVIDDDETPSRHIVKEEKNTVSVFENADNNSSVKIYQEELSISVFDVKAEVQLPPHDDRNIDKAESPVDDNHEKEEKNEQHEETPGLSAERDEEPDEPLNIRHSPKQAENAGEEDEDDEKINEDDHEHKD